MTDPERWQQRFDRWYARLVGSGMYRMALDADESTWSNPYRLKKDCDRPDAYTFEMGVYGRGPGLLNLQLP